MTTPAVVGNTGMDCEQPLLPAVVGAGDSGMSSSTLVCPRCERPALCERQLAGVIIDLCGDCGGIWLDQGELERLLVRLRGGPTVGRMRVPSAAIPWRRNLAD